MAALFSKNNIMPLLFFALAGTIWGGWDLYDSDPPATYPLTIIGAILLGILGGGSLGFFRDNRPKEAVKMVGFGLAGVIVGFVAAWLGIYTLSILGSYVALIVPDPLIDTLSLKPNLSVALYWLNFAFAGAIIGLFFALGLKTKIWPVVWRSTAGFGLASLVAPIVGNLIGNLFNSVLLSYLITFIFISKTLGLMILWGAQKQRDVQGPS